MSKKKEKKEAKEEDKDDKEIEKEAAKEEKKGGAKDVAKGGAEAPPAGEGAEGEGKKKSHKKLIIIIVLAVVLLAGGGAAAWFTGLIGKHKEAAADAESEKGGSHTAPGQPVYYNMPEFLVNLNSGSKQVSFLKMTIALELSADDETKVVEANLPRILDAFNSYLRELRSSDVTGSAGLYRLREELLIRLNKLLAPVKVNDILFKEILVQ